MTKVTEKFTSRVLNEMLLESMKNLNTVKDALDTSEVEIKKQLDEITKLIIKVEV